MNENLKKIIAGNKSQIEKKVSAKMNMYNKNAMATTKRYLKNC